MITIREKAMFGVALAACLLLAAGAQTGGMSSLNYQIPVDVVSGGGNSMSSVNYTMSSTLGQPSPLGPATSASYDNYPGFWQADQGVYDADGDGLTNWDENGYGTDPYNPDSDFDGLDDYLEQITIACLDPLNNDSDGDGAEDGDSTLSGLAEDLNNNGVVDPGEADPCDPDTDDDGLLDGQEIYSLCLNVVDWDTDSDYLPDGYEFGKSAEVPPLDPCDGADGPMNYDTETNPNPNVHEYWNGTDPWSDDPIPSQFLNPACYYFGEGDGTDGVAGPGDLAVLELEIAGVPQTYANVIPQNVFDTQDLDKDGVPGPGDIAELEGIVTGADRPAGWESSPTGLSVVYEPGAAVAVGSTTHVTLSVDNSALFITNSSAFSVVFWIDPASAGDAELLGGEGEDTGQAFANRYDVSEFSAAGGLSNIVLAIKAPGTITINAMIPACGIEPAAKWCSEVVLNPPVVITGE